MASPSHSSTAPPVARLIDAFRKLPGIGPKSAQRLTYHLIRMPRPEAEALAEAIISIKDRIVLCAVCQNITEKSPCPICSDKERDRTRICVVEEALDALAIERTRSYNGLY
ncbi:MAG: recombination protein RecR, partial [Chloroflexi bacterium]|nr:recombination protein RecR [Chloroflexota bacterium]